MKKYRLTRALVERMCANAGMKPEKKSTFDKHEIYIADGSSFVPHFTYKRFGVTPHEFKNGAHCTIWFVAKGEDHFEVGHPILFDMFHDPGLSVEKKKDARVNRAMQEAKQFLEMRANAH